MCSPSPKWTRPAGGPAWVPKGSRGSRRLEVREGCVGGLNSCGTVVPGCGAGWVGGRLRGPAPLSCPPYGSPPSGLEDSQRLRAQAQAGPTQNPGKPRPWPGPGRPGCPLSVKHGLRSQDPAGWPGARLRPAPRCFPGTRAGPASVLAASTPAWRGRAGPPGWAGGQAGRQHAALLWPVCPAGQGRLPRPPGASLDSSPIRPSIHPSISPSLPPSQGAGWARASPPSECTCLAPSDPSLAAPSL